MESRSSTPDTRIFRPVSPVVGIDHNGKVIPQNVDQLARSSLDALALRPSSDSPESISSCPPRPTTALHSHPTSAGLSPQDALLLRKHSVESFEVQAGDDEADGLSTIPEHQSPSPHDTSHLRDRTADSHKPAAPNFSRPFGAREGLANGATSSIRPSSSRSGSADFQARNGSFVAIEPMLRPVSQPPLSSASGSMSSKNAKYSSRSLFVFPADDAEQGSELVSTDRSNSSNEQVKYIPIIDQLRDAPPEDGAKPQTISTSSTSPYSGASAPRLGYGIDEQDNASASSESMASRRYPPSLSSEYAAATSQNGSASATNSKKRSPAHEQSFIASEYDTSALSEKKLQKLRKRGIDPALYLEMKAAKGTRGKCGHVLGHAPL